jgi:hypothetical protein
MAVAGAPGRSSGELDNNQGPEVGTEEREIGIDGGRMLRDLDLYTPPPDTDPNETTDRPPGPRTTRGEIALAAREAYGLSDPLAPLPGSAWSRPETPAAAPPSISVPAPDAAACAVELTALVAAVDTTGPATGPEVVTAESATLDLAPFFEVQSDAPLRQFERPWQHDLAFLAAVAVAWSADGPAAAPGCIKQESPPRQRLAKVFSL